MERGFPLPGPLLLVKAQRMVFPVSRHAVTHILSRPGCWDPSVIPTGAKWGLENGSSSLRRCTSHWCSDIVPLGHFWVPARRRRVTQSLLPGAWCWEHSWAEIPSLSPNFPAAVLPWCRDALQGNTFTSEDQLVLGGRGMTLPSHFGFSTCTVNALAPVRL